MNTASISFEKHTDTNPIAGNNGAFIYFSLIPKKFQCLTFSHKT